MDKPIVEIKERLKKAMQIREIAPIELSEKTHIPKSSISQYMSGYAKPKQDRIYLLSKALNVNETWLMGYDVQMDKRKLTAGAAKEDFELIEKFSLLKEKDKVIVLNLIDSLIEKSGD